MFQYFICFQWVIGKSFIQLHFLSNFDVFLLMTHCIQQFLESVQNLYLICCVLFNNKINCVKSFQSYTIQLYNFMLLRGLIIK